MELIEYARLCRLSYEPHPVGFIDVEDLRFGVFDRGDCIVVVFRGSDNNLNWLRDFDVLPARQKTGAIAHGGFSGAADALEPHLACLADTSQKPVIFCGHSLGGGIATVMADRHGCKAVTFGCPRPWWRMMEPPTLDHVRVVCDDDPVPKVPALSYQHDGKPPVELRDADGGWIDPEEHAIDVYIKRLGA